MLAIYAEATLQIFMMVEIFAIAFVLLDEGLQTINARGEDYGKN
jgi:hypothetical protein